VKKYKPLLAKLKWRLRLAQIFLLDSKSKNALLNTNFSAIRIDSFEKDLRQLLRLNPAWLKGHYLHGIASFHLYQNTKESYYLGSLNISLSLLEERRHDPGHIFVLKCLVHFASRNYSLFAKEIKEDSGNVLESLNFEEQAIINEHAGLSLITLNEEKLAKEYFKKIPEYKMSKETISILANIS